MSEFTQNFSSDFTAMDYGQELVTAVLGGYFAFWNVNSLPYRHDQAAIQCTVRHNAINTRRAS